MLRSEEEAAPMSFPPPDPPPPAWDGSGGSSPDFDQAHSDANNYGSDGSWGIKDQTGTSQYLYVGKSTTAGQVAWAFRTVANSGSCAQAKIPSATFNVIKGGTLTLSTGKIAYGGNNYVLYLQVDGNGNQIAFAKLV